MSSRFIYDHKGHVASEVIVEPDEVTFAMHENIVPQLEQTKRERDAYMPRRNEVFRPIANVPETVVAMALREGWFHDKQRWKKWVNDSHNKNWRITDGRF